MSTDVNGLGAHAAVDLDIFVRETGTEFSHFGHTSLEEFLAAAA
jgi:hypothetical protein